MSDGLPKGWASAPVAEVIEDFQPGFASGEKNVEGGVAHLRMNNIGLDGELVLDLLRTVPEKLAKPRRDLSPGDVLVCTTNSGALVGKCAYFDLPGRYAFSNHLTRLRPKRDVVDGRFLRWNLWLHWKRGLFNDKCKHWVNQSTLPKNALLEDEVVVPPLAEQRRIVAKLETLLSKVDVSRQRLAKISVLLKRFRQSVLATACSGRLTADWREERTTDFTDDTDKKPSAKSAKSVVKETASSLLDKIGERRKQLWAQQRKAKGLAANPVDYPEPATPSGEFEFEVPESWELCSMDALTSVITSGSRDWKQYYRNDGSGTFIMAQNVRPLRFDRSYRLAVAPPENDRDRSRSEVFKDDLLVTIVGANTADCCRVPERLREHYVCQSVALIRPVLPETSCFLELFLNSPGHGLAEWRKWIYGEGRPHLSFDNLRETLVCLPPLPEQQEIVRRVEGLFALADQLEVRLAKARGQVDALTPSLLARAFAGQLVPQDPTDEPAEKLLEHLRTKKG